MLTTQKNAPKHGTPASPLKPVARLSKDLQFAAANQQMEGFPGKIAKVVAAHEPNLRGIAEDAKRFGAQVPTDENLNQPPLFPLPKTSRP